ncbi:glycogen debranching N-terminal domain-containing protein [soil metagenome]
MNDLGVVLKSSDLFLLMDAPDRSSHDRSTGMYARDTRYLNGIRVTLNGEAPEWLATTLHHASAATITTANPALIVSGATPLLPHQIAIEERVTLDSGLHISYVIQNYARMPVDIVLGLLISADFHDLFEVRGFPRPARGTMLRPHAHQRAIHLRYQGVDGLVNCTRVNFDRTPQLSLRRDSGYHPEKLITLLPGQDEVHWETAPDDMIGVSAEFPVRIEVGERWELLTSASPEFGDGVRATPVPVIPGHSPTERASIETDNPFFNRLLTRSEEDLAALMTSFPHGTLPAAGIPWYVAPFGRDSLITGLQTFHLAPRDAEGTLRILAALQGKKSDEFTEEQPGKILHEMRYGEMARTGEVPHRPYYGTVDATSLFVLLFAETVAWTADDTLYHDLMAEVQAALEWIETYGDLDGDGLIEYRTDQASSVHIRHQVWKDSHDSLHHIDGNQARGNITPVEVQAYTYAAYRRLAEVCSGFGDERFATELRVKALELQQKFGTAFWVEEDRYLAQALDGEKQPVRAVSSNPAQILFTGILSDEQAHAVINRIQHPDMDSGWGIRTLSSAALSYNPMSYHNGSVWPHDNSLIAAGCYRQGAGDAANRIFASLFDVGMRSEGDRLNELYCGFGRAGTASDQPVAYPGACSPQAWAAGCYPHLIRSALGLVADVESGTVKVAPHLPAFIDRVTIRNMTVMGRTGSITVSRNGSEYHVRSSELPLQEGV